MSLLLLLSINPIIYIIRSKMCLWRPCRSLGHQKFVLCISLRTTLFVYTVSKLILRRVYLILRLTRAHLTNITTHAVQHAGDPSFRGKHSLLRLLLKFLLSKINVYFYSPTYSLPVINWLSAVNCESIGFLQLA